LHSCATRAHGWLLNERTSEAFNDLERDADDWAVETLAQRNLTVSALVAGWNFEQDNGCTSKLTVGRSNQLRREGN